MTGFTVQRKDADGNPVGQRLTFTEESFIIESLDACPICDHGAHAAGLCEADQHPACACLTDSDE